MNILLYMEGVLSGAPSMQDKHRKRLIAIQSAIFIRWGIKNPEQWRVKHLRWFLQEHMKDNAASYRYDFWLTVREITKRRGRELDWEPRLRGPWTRPAKKDT